MMEAARTSETSVDSYFTRQYIPEDKSEQCIVAWNTIALAIIIQIVLHVCETFGDNVDIYLWIIYLRFQ
jgi:hypothetical protein